MARHRILAALAAAALIVVIAGGFVASRADLAPADLMRPGPLGEQTLGDANAPNVIIEYASMTCTHCAQFHSDVFPVLKQRGIDTGKVRYIFREFPLDSLALAASMLARCAGKDKFFPTIELMFRTQGTWVVDKPLGPLLATVKQVGLTEESAKACLADQKILDGVRWVQNNAQKNFKVDATPAFFVNGKLTMRLFGLTLYDIDELLKPAAPAK